MTLTEIQTALVGLGLRPSKALGQNFLHDQNLARWIVEHCGVGPGDEVVEIGPGLGALTQFLCPTGANLLLIEHDRRLAKFLEQRYADERVTIAHCDAAQFDPRPLFARGPLTVIGNLPYSAASPILFNFASSASPANQVIIMVQREFASRLLAAPGSADYGVPTVLLGLRWKAEKLKQVGESVFHPRPNVGSTIVRLRRREAKELPPCDQQAFERLVKLGFSQRRKQLAKLLKAEVPEWPAVAARLGVPPTARAEELSVPQWVQLTNEAAPPTGDGPGKQAQDVFDVVDGDDRVVGQENRPAIHVNNFLHRAVHIFLVNSSGELLLQKRSAWKDQHPGRWDSSAAGHLDVGESYEAAAGRELEEELGVKAELTEAGRLPAGPGTGYEFIRIFTGRCDGPFRFSPWEIETGCFFPVDLVADWLRRRPDDFASGFRECFKIVFPSAGNV